MTTYICKCGRTFQKSTEAGTTGFRMPDYGPGHECYGCPFVQKECWREGGKDVDAYACRGSKVLDYQTDAYCCESKGAALHVRTLDLEFIQKFFKDYLALPGHNYEHLYHGMDSAENGRWQYSFGFTANKQGEVDRNALIDRYFRSAGEQPGALPSGCDKLVRKDVTPEQEKEIVLNQIRKAKEEVKTMNSYYAPCGHKFSRAAGGATEISVEVTGTTAGCFACPHGLHEPETDEHGPRIMCTCSRKKVVPEDTPITLEESIAQGMDSPVETGVKYYHNGLVYFAGKREDNGKYTVLLDDADNPGPDTRTEVATIPDFDTFDAAQNALDGLALKRGFFPAKSSTAAEAPEMEQQTVGSEPDENSDFVPSVDIPPEVEQAEEMNELAGCDDLPEEPESDINSENVDGEQPPQPCDWKNASGADEKEDEDEVEDDEVSGDPLSLRGSEFDSIISAADGVLNRLVTMLHAKNQHDGEMTVKITFEDCGCSQYVFGGAVSGKINYTVKPQKIVGDTLELQFDAQGNPIVPADREHQLNFDEIQPGQREYPPTGGTAMVDGKTGIVEDYQDDGEEPEDPPTSEDATNSAVGDDLEDSEESEKLYPCKNSECPFYVYDPGDPDASGCDFSNPDSFDVAEAVEQNGCTRPEVLEAYSEDRPAENESEENEE